jgi:hypothetical protein
MTTKCLKKSKPFFQIVIFCSMAIPLITACQSKPNDVDIEKIKHDVEAGVTEEYSEILKIASLSYISDIDFNRIKERLKNFPIKEGINIIDTLQNGNLFILNKTTSPKCCGMWVYNHGFQYHQPVAQYIAEALESPMTCDCGTPPSGHPPGDTILGFLCAECFAECLAQGAGSSCLKLCKDENGKSCLHKH